MQQLCGTPYELIQPACIITFLLKSSEHRYIIYPSIICHHVLEFETQGCILKHYVLHLHYFKRLYLGFHKFSKIIFTVLETKRLYFYIVNWRNSLENHANHLCVTFEDSGGERAKRL